MKRAAMTPRHRRRHHVAEESLWRCWYCQAPLACAACEPDAENVLTIDHVKPSARGGTSGLWNVVAACRSCNSAKADKPLSTFQSEWTRL